VLLRRCATIAGLVLGACGPGGGPDPSTCHFGDKTLPLQASIVIQRVGNVADFADGGTVPLVRPPQFGRIALVGVRATNFEGCNLTVNAAFRDPCTGHILGLEERPVVMAPRGDGWAIPFQPGEISNYANVSLCPSSGTSADGFAATLEVRVTDPTGRSVTLTAKATPSCEGDTTCPQDCMAYIDAGLVDAACAAPDGAGSGSGGGPIDAAVDAPVDAAIDAM
jgi:hypothetical protein